ncbi:hypothetical protein KC19_4G251900 [Ceratodon purpureus]|uniref:MYND-type domain-containing protein n=1 Tax=Ceratodon purpureus TaxID=3225 RepID=A0A8T0ICH1_CERPU|nr:hypothetical protein KC19_4G251900 [Ceratodon purpureus]
MKGACRCGHDSHAFEDTGEDDSDVHDRFAGVKAALLAHREKLIAAAKAGKSLDSDTRSSSYRHYLNHEAEEESAAALSALTVKECAHCNSGGKLFICTGCRKTYYCSREHQAADWRNGHRETCKTGGSRPSGVKAGPVLEPGERPLSIEMLELAELFKSVHKDMPEENKEGALRKVIHVCELIIKRGNPDNIPIPQVFYMLQEARQMIRPFVQERENREAREAGQTLDEPQSEPEVKPKPRLESKPKVEVTPRQVETSAKQPPSTKQTTSKKKSGKKGRRRVP